jgi:hypothetical protein
MTGEAHKSASARTLSEADLDDAAYLAQVVDSNGEAPQAADGTANSAYTSTVDLYKAASIAWSQKASIFAEQFAFAQDGGSFQRNQAYDMAVKQAARYADMSSGSSSTAPVGRA